MTQTKSKISDQIFIWGLNIMSEEIFLAHEIQITNKSDKFM